MSVRSLSLVLCLLTVSPLAHATELARINGKVITLEGFLKKYKESIAYMPNRAPSKKAVLDDLIKRELGIQEAVREGLNRDPEVIDRMNTALYEALLRKNLEKAFSAIQVSDDEARAYYQKNPEVRTSHIFIPITPAQDEKHALEKIRKIYDEEVRPGKKSFAEVAQQFSEGPNAPMGGDMDYQTKDRLDPAYFNAAIELRKPGRVSGIVHTAAGFHIIKLTAIRPWEEADHAHVKRMLFEERREAIFERYMSQLKRKARISVHYNLLKG